MRILLAPVGSRGDFQPLLALALALRRHGHEPILAAPPTFAEWAAAERIPFHSVGRDLKSFLGSQAHLIADRPVSGLLTWIKFVEESIYEQFADMRTLMTGVDLVLGASLQFAAPSLAEAAGIPYRFVTFCPQTMPSQFHPPPIIPWLNMPAAANRTVWNVLMWLYENRVSSHLNGCRQKLGLAPIDDIFRHLFSAQPLLAADPELAWLPSDLGHVVQTHSWIFDDPRPLEPALERFIARGQAPIYVGFGSMTDPRPQQTTALVIAAAKRLGRRLILSQGWAELGQAVADDRVLVVGGVPHLKLFPEVAAIVHHGGAGTTAAATRSGRPQVVVPHFADQRYWAKQVAERGLGPRCVPRTRLTLNRLTEALDQALNDRTTGRRCQDLALALCGKNGIDQAIALFDRTNDRTDDQTHATMSKVA